MMTLLRKHRPSLRRLPRHLQPLRLVHRILKLSDPHQPHDPRMNCRFWLKRPLPKANSCKLNPQKRLRHHRQRHSPITVPYRSGGCRTFRLLPLPLPRPSPREKSYRFRLEGCLTFQRPPQSSLPRRPDSPNYRTCAVSA